MRLELPDRPLVGFAALRMAIRLVHVCSVPCVLCSKDVHLIGAGGMLSAGSR